MVNGTSSVGALFGAGLMVATGINSVDAQTSASSSPDPSLVTRGAYLAKAADCMPCHTSAKDKQFAGGMKLDTPFGAIFSPNITPDPDTGIGRWTYEDFKNAVHAGIRADGSYLYPVMTYDAFTLITEDDLKALWAYFRSIPAIKQQNRGNELGFPFDIRLTLMPWRWLFFTEGYYKQNPAKGPQWNRGAYLVEALAHCSDCHTPRNFMSATIASKWLQGARIDQWYAPSITAEALRAVNKWDKARLVAFLRKGAGNNTTVLGPMQEVVHDSLSFLTESDLDAMATFLLDLPPGAETPPKPVAKKLAPDVEARATKLYSDNCASCHQADGAHRQPDPAAGRQPGNPCSQTVRHPGGCAAGRSGARRHYCDAELCGLARRSERGRPRQLRAHQLRQRGVPERHPQHGGGVALDAIATGLRQRISAHVRLPQRRSRR